MNALQEFRVSIKGPLTTPVGSGIRSLNVTLRQVLDLMTEAAAGALADAGLERGDIDGLICGYATTMPHLMPMTAAIAPTDRTPAAMKPL